MIITQLDHVSRLYGADVILEDICLQLQDDARLGLIGPNGSGKTTLARIIAGDLEPSEGQVIRSGGPSIGYLRQTCQIDPEMTVWGVVHKADRRVRELAESLHEMETRIAEGAATQAEMDRYGLLHDQFGQLGGYDYEARCETVLERLGFPPETHNQSVAVLSGGQRSRLDLASILIRQPQILVLDEPTNHLDLDATEWLEGFLASYSGAVVVISHDRVFLDRVVTEILEVIGTGATLYPGNYTRYTELKAEREASLMKAYRLQQDEIRRTEDFVRRNMAGVKTKMAQSRQRSLERMERITPPPAAMKPVSLRFDAKRRGGNDVLYVRDMMKAYGENTLFRDVEFTLRRGERLGIVGPNGSGKSTLLRVIVGEEPADSGTTMFGTGIDVGYFDQRLAGLDARATVMDEVWSVNPQMEPVQVRSFLGSFLFSEDEQFRVIGTLSGGEQNRVALAKLVLARMNLLILDEPTNHLDITSRLVLEEALARFDGTLIVVSHDRALLRRLTNRILWIEDGEASLHDMGFAAFEEVRAQKRAEALAAAAGRRAVSDEKAERMAGYERKKAEERERRRTERRLQETEEAIAKAEARLAELDDALGSADGGTDWTALEQMTQEREEVQSRLNGLYEEWAELEHAMAAFGEQ